MLCLKNVSAGYAGRLVLRDLSLCIPDGLVTGIVGRNGCGKSTLLRVAAGQLRPMSGTVYANGVSLLARTPRAIAREVALLPQERNIPAMTAGMLVMCGRYAHMRFPHIPGKKEELAVQKALAHMGVEDFYDRELRQLSGGERQRVYFAMLLAQEAPVLLLDEPGVYLDLPAQYELLTLLRGLCPEGKAVAVVMHDLTQAVSFCDQVILLHEGEVKYAGAGNDLCESGLLSLYMQVLPHKMLDPDNGKNIYYFTGLENQSE